MDYIFRSAGAESLLPLTSRVVVQDTAFWSSDDAS